MPKDGKTSFLASSGGRKATEATWRLLITSLTVACRVLRSSITLLYSTQYLTEVRQPGPPYIHASTTPATRIQRLRNVHPSTSQINTRTFNVFNYTKNGACASSSITLPTRLGLSSFLHLSTPRPLSHLRKTWTQCDAPIRQRLPTVHKYLLVVSSSSSGASAICTNMDVIPKTLVALRYLFHSQSHLHGCPATRCCRLRS